MEQDETILREINDNLSYRDYTKKIEDLKKEKYEKEEELNTMPTKQELRKLLTEMQKEHSQKNDEEQQLKGVMHQLQQQVAFPGLQCGSPGWGAHGEKKDVDA